MGEPIRREVSTAMNSLAARSAAFAAGCVLPDFSDQAYGSVPVNPPGFFVT